MDVQNQKEGGCRGLQLLSSKGGPVDDCGDGQKQLTGRTKCRVSVQVHWRDASTGLVLHTGVAGGAGQGVP